MQLNETCPLPSGDATTLLDAMPGTGRERGSSIARRAVVVSMSEVAPEPVEWLWHMRIPLGKLTLFAGDPGLGKSFVTLDIASRVSTGSKWPDQTGLANEPGNVILLNAEDDLGDTIRPRLDAAGADVSRIRAITAVKIEGEDGEKFFSLDHDLGVLEIEIAVLQPKLVVIDPIGAYLGKTDSHKDAAIRGLLAPLAKIAADHDCAILLVTHLNKNEEGDKAMYRVTGSNAWVAASRVAWMFAIDREDQANRLIVPLKTNLSVKPPGIAYRINGDPPRVEWDSTPIDLDPDGLVGDCGQNTTKLKVAESFLSGILARGPVPMTEVEQKAESAGISARTLVRAKKELAVVSDKAGFGEDGPWNWRLPT